MALAGTQWGTSTRTTWSMPRVEPFAGGQNSCSQPSLPVFDLFSTARILRDEHMCMSQRLVRREASWDRSEHRSRRSRRLQLVQAVASTSTGSVEEEVEEADIANRNPYLEGDFEIGDDEEWEEVPLHRVKIYDSKEGRTLEVDVPEDRYILHSAEEQGHTLPFACRMGCCTSCAVRVKSGKVYQPLSLGISNELKAQGYALMCVAYPLSDLEVETQDEDEVYWMQFGKYFARGPIERDDIALEIALQDE